jgi:hypothetical protein
MTATQQTQIVIPGVAVRPYTLTVNRDMGLIDGAAAEVITSLALSQTLSVRLDAQNPAAQGFSTFTWTWTCPQATPTDDLATALAQAGWDTALPCLDSSRGYTITVAS